MFVLASGIEVEADFRRVLMAYPEVSVFPGMKPGTLLLSFPQKSIRLSDLSQIIPDLSLSPAQKQILWKIIGQNIEPALYWYATRLPPLRVITFNLAGAIQYNVVQGSEAIQVQRCQQAYPQYGGWASPDKSLSMCMLNAVHWLGQHYPDIAGCQEVVPKYVPKMLAELNSQTGQEYSAISAGTTAIIYNARTMGPGQLLSSPNLHIRDPGRSLMIVWFPFYQLLVINLHAPHQIDLVGAITQTVASVPIKVQPSRLIVMGDFNDVYNKTPLTSLPLLGFNLRQTAAVPRSCCTDSQYQYRGDYIFDSQNTPQYYGIPDDDALKILMSDHHPVMYDSQ